VDDSKEAKLRISAGQLITTDLTREEALEAFSFSPSVRGMADMLISNDMLSFASGMVRGVGDSLLRILDEEEHAHSSEP
jgi:hypothetical protein